MANATPVHKPVPAPSKPVDALAEFGPEVAAAPAVPAADVAALVAAAVADAMAKFAFSAGVAVTPAKNIVIVSDIAEYKKPGGAHVGTHDAVREDL